MPTLQQAISNSKRIQEDHDNRGILSRARDYIFNSKFGNALSNINDFNPIGTQRNREIMGNTAQQFFNPTSKQFKASDERLARDLQKTSVGRNTAQILEGIRQGVPMANRILTTELAPDPTNLNQKALRYAAEIGSGLYTTGPLAEALSMPSALGRYTMPLSQRIGGISTGSKAINLLAKGGSNAIKELPRGIAFNAGRQLAGAGQGENLGIETGLDVGIDTVVGMTPLVGALASKTNIDNKLIKKGVKNLVDDTGSIFKQVDDPEKILDLQPEDIGQRVIGGLNENFESNNPLRRIKYTFNRIFKPLDNAPSEVKDMVTRWNSRILEGRVKANEIATKLTHIPEDDGFKIVQYIENPTVKKAKELGLDTARYSGDIAKIKSFYRNLRKKGISSGLDIGYLDNYINHVWKESPSEIAKVRGLGTTAQFQKERMIPTYQEGLKLGLTPMFTHPSQLVAHYRNQLNKALANKALADDLFKSGIMLPNSQAPVEWVELNGPFFPKAQRMVSKGKFIIENYKASPETAEAINNLFAHERQGLVHLASNVSKVMQDITLSGGIPRTPVNAFTVGNIIKEVTAGRIVSPVTSFFRSFNPKSTKDYFNKNVEYIEAMGRQGLRFSGDVDYTNLYENLATNKSLWEKLGTKFENLINKPTFARFMPQLELNAFKDVFDSAVKKGMSKEQAEKLAGETVKAFYGVQQELGRKKFVEDSLSALFFAPRFRESMIKFWASNIKSVSTKVLDPAYKYNRRFMAGTALTYMMYSLLNKEISGHYMHENKNGKQFYLEVPHGDGESTFIPMLPSIGTIPRKATETIGQYGSGNIRKGTQTLASFTSQPLSLATQLATNRTFYGGPIAGKDENGAGAYAGYIIEQTSHPLIGEPLAVAQGRKTATEGALGILELPAYRSKSSTPESEVIANQGTGKGWQFFKGLFKRNEAKASEDEILLPENEEDFGIVYKDIISDINRLEKKLKMVSYETKTKNGVVERLSDKEIESKKAQYNQELGILNDMKSRLEDGRPDMAETYEYKSYASGGSFKVTERGDWALTKLKTAKDDKEFADIVKRLWDEKVLTTGSSGVAEYIKDKSGIDLSDYRWMSIASGKTKGKRKSTRRGSRASKPSTYNPFDTKSFNPISLNEQLQSKVNTPYVLPDILGTV